MSSNTQVVNLSRRARVVKAIRAIFDPNQYQTGASISLFLGITITLALLVNNASSLLAVLGNWMFGLVAKPGEEFMRALTGCLPSFVLFLFFFLKMWFYVNRFQEKQTGVTVKEGILQPHAGLIVLLSTFNNRRQSRFADYKEVEQALDAYIEAKSTRQLYAEVSPTVSAAGAPSVAHVGDPVEGAMALDFNTLRQELLLSNWGPLVVAAEFHGRPLRHCWIVCTKGGSSDQFEAAKRVVRFFNDTEGLKAEKVECYEVEAGQDPSPASLVPRIEALYHEAALKKLEADDIVADITGGTAAMSGGLLLATLSNNRHIEYLSQMNNLVVDGKAKTKEEIGSQHILSSLVTSPLDLPAHARLTS